MFVTNVRIVWVAKSNETFNVSVPFYQITQIYERESKYGPTMVVRTGPTGGYVLCSRCSYCCCCCRGFLSPFKPHACDHTFTRFTGR
jgi:hypothetical protein